MPVAFLSGSGVMALMTNIKYIHTHIRINKKCQLQCNIYISAANCLHQEHTNKAIQYINILYCNITYIYEKNKMCLFFLQQICIKFFLGGALCSPFSELQNKKSAWQ